MFILKTILKMVVLSLTLFLSIVNLAVNGAFRVYAFACSIVYPVLAVCALIAIYKQMWRQLLIIALMVGVSCLAIPVAGTILVIIDLAKEKMKGAVRI